jgi:hypothetical protein
MTTARSYLGHHDVHAICDACQHVGQIDLQRLVDVGLGDVPMIDLDPRMRCTACGAQRCSSVVSGRVYPSLPRG